MTALLSKIIKLNHLHVIGIIKTDNGYNYNVLTVKKQGNKINLIATASFDTVEELNKVVDRKLPVLLVIDGKGVLNKEINPNDEADVNWQKNIDFSTIYYTSFNSLPSNFISFCRRNIVDETLLQFRKTGFQVADIYIGSFLASLLYSSIKKENILSNDLSLDFNNEKLISFTKKSDTTKMEEYIIGKDTISSVFLPLYGALVHFFIQPKKVSKTKNITLNVEEIIYKKAFNTFAIIILIGFFTSLLASYMLIQYYGSKNAELNLQNVYSNQSYQIILDLEKQKENKVNILKQSGALSSKFLSYYAYEIMKLIPSEISLTQLNIIPLVEETKENKKTGFDAGVIVVKGETFKESSFQDWMIALKKMDWIQQFEIISLKKDKKNKSHFEIKIAIKNV